MKGLKIFGAILLVLLLIAALVIGVGLLSVFLKSAVYHQELFGVSFGELLKLDEHLTSAKLTVGEQMTREFTIISAILGIALIDLIALIAIAAKSKTHTLGRVVFAILLILSVLGGLAFLKEGFDELQIHEAFGGYTFKTLKEHPDVLNRYKDCSAYYDILYSWIFCGICFGITVLTILLYVIPGKISQKRQISKIMKNNADSIASS